ASTACGNNCEMLIISKKGGDDSSNNLNDVSHLWLNGLGDISHDIVDIFDANGDSDQTVGDAVRFPDFFRDIEMGHGCRVEDKGIHVAKRWSQSTKPNLLQGANPGIEAAFEFKAEDASMDGHLTAREGVVGVRRKPGIVDPAHGF